MVAMPWTRGVLVAIAIAVVMAGCAGYGAGAASSGSAGGPATPPVSSLAAPDGMATVTVAALPPEAAATLLLIAAGGPFPNRQDGVTFENREGLLPVRASGYYREYTVPTPGSADRGARRIVIGASGERYWTGDHYDSFAWIAP